MANYLASCRTNYFRVKDPEAFKAALSPIADIEIVERDGHFMLLGRNEDGAGWPTSYHNEDECEDVEFDLQGTVAPFLADGEVAIFMEVGAERLRYLVGYAVAVNNKGERRTVSLQDIYREAAELAPENAEITRVEY